MRITLCDDHARRFRVTHGLAALEYQGSGAKCHFCPCTGTVYEATPRAARPQRKKPPYIQNKEKQMQRRMWA